MIRLARAEDVVRIGEIARSAYARYVPRIGREPAPMMADYDADARAGRIVVLEVERSIIGYLVAWPEDDAYFIENIGIDRHLQGKGWGRRLIDHAAIEAAHLGLSALRLYTNAAMTENLSMYAHLGFVETHRVTQDGFNRVYMRLNLADRQTLANPPNH
jgi:ribosomal protein S18 acetylase RimI-like enzyme